MWKVKYLLLAFAVLALAAPPAAANFVEVPYLVTDDYRISGTPIYLFAPTSPYNPSGPTPGFMWNQNNAAPINYPCRPSYYPSPGARHHFDAEHYDLEGLFYKYDAANGELKVWLVSSMGPDGYGYLHIGDVFVDVNGDAAYDYALLSFGKKPGLNGKHRVKKDNVRKWRSCNDRVAGGLAILDEDSVLHGINGYGYVGNPTIRNLTNPWAVNFAADIQDGDLFYEELTGDEINALDFAGGPPGYPPRGDHSTFVYMWDVDILDGLIADNFGFHVTVQCGNDALWEANNIPTIPAPGAVVLALIGSIMVGARSILGLRKP